MATATAPAGKQLDRWMNREGDRLSEVLGSVAGLKMRDAYRGTLAVGNRQAQLRIEPHQWVRVCLELGDPPDPRDALRVNHWLPGNLRYAGSRRRMVLLADTQLDGVAHLPASLEEIRGGLADATSNRVRSPPGDTGQRPAPPAADPDLSRLEAALGRLPFGEDALVRRDDTGAGAAWEVRPRVEGDPVPVLVDCQSGGLRLHRAVLAGISAAHAAAVADQALRFNEQFRLCRLACAGDQWVVETLLHAGLIETGCLASAAQAVAVASHRAQDTLHALAQYAPLVQWYSALFGDAVPGASPG